MRNKYLMWGGILVIIAVLGAYIWYASMQKETRETIDIDIAVSLTPLSAPLFIAQEKGFFEEEGLNVTMVTYIGGFRCLQSVLMNETDMGTVSELPIMFNSFKRDDYAIITTFARSDNDVKIIVRKNSGIVTPQDLRGKRIGVIPGSSSQYFLDSVLVIHGINFSDAYIVLLPPENMSRALISGEVDAISVWEPFGYETVNLLEDDAIVLPGLEIYTETFNLVVLKNYAESNPEAINRTLRALDRSISFLNTNEKEAQDILVKRLDVDKGFIKWIWPDFIFELSLDQSLLMTLENEARWLIGTNQTNVTSTPNYLDLIHMENLKEIKPGAVTIIY